MTAIRIEDVRYGYEDHHYRTAIKFGGVALDRVTLLNVQCRVRTRSGKSALGQASMPLGNNWAFPSKKLDYATTLTAMKEVAAQMAILMDACQDYGHPIELICQLEPALRHLVPDIAQRLNLGEPIPPLATAVAASPFDAALHDGFGKVHDLNCYSTYGRGFLRHDLAHFLGPLYRGLHLEDFINRLPRPTIPVYHTVGALDPLRSSEVAVRLNDGLPESLDEWILADRLSHFKIKLNGDDLAWDVDRVTAVEQTAADTQNRLGYADWRHSLDFNERCPNTEYLLEFLRKVEERSPQGFARIQYVEQPTARDLKANPDCTMHDAAKIRPVVVDESLLGLESLNLARQMGYTGVAIKACKGQTQSLLMAAAAQVAGMFLTVQDLTCPGAALIHSAGLAAHVPGVAAIEANARQYVPAASVGWEERFPGIFRIRDGVMMTGQLTGAGLGVGWNRLFPS